MKKVSFKAEGEGTGRLVINGLGFVEFIQKGQQITVYVPSPVEVSLQNTAISK